VYQAVGCAILASVGGGGGAKMHGILLFQFHDHYSQRYKYTGIVPYMTRNHGPLSFSLYHGPINYIDTKAKCRHHPPPHAHYIRVYSLLIHTGKGTELNQREVREATVHKTG
jgi:hypothetical protein